MDWGVGSILTKRRARTSARSAGGDPQATAPDWIVTTAQGSRAGSVLRSNWGRRALALGALMIVVAAGAVGAERWANARLTAAVNSTIDVMHGTRIEAIRTWCSGRVQQGMNVVNDRVTENALVALTTAGEDVRAHVLRELRNDLATRSLLEDVDGLVVLDTSGNGWAYSDRVQRSGIDFASLPEFRRAIHGDVTLSPPVAPVPSRPSGFEPERSSMFVFAPVSVSNGTSMAVVGLRFDPSSLSRVLELGRVGETGESIAFDERGHLLTNSRFADELRREGVEPLPHVFEIREPAEPGKEARFTRPVEATLEGRLGSSPTTWRDYRGHEVIGSWTFLPEWRLGLITKIDRDEALVVLDAVHWANLALVLALAVAGVGLLFNSRFTMRLEAHAAEFMALGQYRLLGKIGEGGMGTVYRAEHALLARPTAIKLLRLTTDATRRRFEREVRLTAGLSHPNTVAIYDYGSTADGKFYYAMELLDGTDLERRVFTDGPLPVGRALHVVRQVLGSLAEAHEHGLVHRDIKPANVMLTTRGGILDFVKVLDFGLVHDESDTSPRLTDDRVVVGTPLYLAPEILISTAPASARSDVYAVGALLYFLLSGREAFEGESLNTVVRKHLSGRRTPLASVIPGGHVPDGIEQLLDSWLALHPNQRPENARAAIEQLEPLLSRYPWSAADAHYASVTRIIVSTPVVDEHGDPSARNASAGDFSGPPEVTHQVGSVTSVAVPRPREAGGKGGKG